MSEEGTALNESTHVVCKSWFEQSYRNHGFTAQRLYPNEELLRFFGRHYFSQPQDQRRNTRILEAGCGSGANLWMIAREGFETHGIDLSAEGVVLCEKMLAHWGTTATLTEADMTAIPYPDQSFDVVLDVLSSNCLDEASFGRFLGEVKRLLRTGGRFFSYAPSKASDAFRNPGSARFIDASTLDGIWRKSAPYFGNSYPFRFIAPHEYVSALKTHGLSVAYNERVGRSYRDGEEYFEYVVIVGENPN
jgi:SAM-dependent methyltransferase